MALTHFLPEDSYYHGILAATVLEHNDPLKDEILVPLLFWSGLEVLFD